MIIINDTKLCWNCEIVEIEQDETYCSTECWIEGN